MAKQKTKGHNLVGRVSKEKANTVADDSLQTRSPGAGPGSMQSAMQSRPLGFGGSVRGERGGPGSQQASWSARQQAQRMRARAEQERLGEAQQSGYGGMQQEQFAGAQEADGGGRGSGQGGGKQDSSRNQAANAGPGEANRVRSSSKGKK